MIHVDLFSGIGGFSYAIDQVFENVEHIFFEIDPFCQLVLKKHWPNSKVYGDIRRITSDTINEYKYADKKIQSGRFTTDPSNTDLLTGGFPCQPFSVSGKRQGKADDRYLWPEMLRVIQLAKPAWVIVENVYGLVSWSEGMVFEQVCSDLESEGYEVGPFIVPACAVGAPHRRDRVWIVAYRAGERRTRDRIQGAGRPGFTCGTGKNKKQEVFDVSDWKKNWSEVAAEFCRVDDGLPARLDGLEFTKSAHRRERLKSLGNAIVPQVAVEIFIRIKEAQASEGEGV